MSTTEATINPNAMDDDSAHSVPDSDNLTVIPDDVYIERISPEAFAINADRPGDDTVRFTAQQVRAFVAYDQDLRKAKLEIDYIPAGYKRFAEVFNHTTETAYRFAYFVKGPNGGDVVANLEFNGPPKSLFGIQPYQCFHEGALVRPGHIEMPVEAFNRYQEIAFQYANVTTNGRNKYEKARLAKQNAQEMAKKVGEGGYHFMPKNDQSTADVAGPSKRARYED